MKGEAKGALILGLGRFGGGQQAVRYLLRRGWRVRISDRSPPTDLRDAVEALTRDAGDSGNDIEWRLGQESVTLLDGIDLVVVNPAVPPHHPVLREAERRGLPLTQEVALFLESFPGQVVMVTGTNGKSTTSGLLSAALARGGRNVLLGGNIGHSLLADELRWHRDQVAVLEISSFQLERLDPTRHSVHGAVFTRIGRDHLDRHGDLSSYRAAKSVAAACASGFVVHADDDPVAAGFRTVAKRRVGYGVRHAAGIAKPEVSCHRGWMHSALEEDPGPLLHRRSLQMLGDFQLENCMAAAAAAALLGIPRHVIAFALATSRPLPYRLQLLREVNGIRLYDNSVSTELESTVLAVRAVAGPVHWVGGGLSKDGDYRAVSEALAPHLASAHLFGDAREPLASLLRRTPISKTPATRTSVTRTPVTHVPVTTSEHLVDALAAAWSAARRGHAVVMSPAFASFDQYPNFRARAEEFRLWAKELRNRKGSTAESDHRRLDWPAACKPLN